MIDPKDEPTPQDIGPSTPPVEGAPVVTHDGSNNPTESEEDYEFGRDATRRTR